VFRFNTALGVTNIDFILAFNPFLDEIRLDNSVFTGLTAGVFVSANDFVNGTSAADGTDRIIFNSSTGQLFFDPDGNGVTQQTPFAKVNPFSPGVFVTAADIFVE
jgi:serralysin